MYFCYYLKKKFIFILYIYISFKDIIIINKLASIVQMSIILYICFHIFIIIIIYIINISYISKRFIVMQILIFMITSIMMLANSFLCDYFNCDVSLSFNITYKYAAYGVKFTLLLS